MSGHERVAGAPLSMTAEIKLALENRTKPAKGPVAQSFGHLNRKAESKGHHRVCGLVIRRDPAL